MAPENFILSTCTQADILAMVELNLSAFANDPLSNITMPREMIGEAELRRWMSQFIASFFEVQVDAYIGNYHRKYIAMVRRNGPRDIQTLSFYWKTS